MDEEVKFPDDRTILLSCIGTSSGSSSYARTTESTFSSDEEESPSFTKVTSTTTSYVLYPRRWFVLASFSVLSMSSAWIWITWSPIATLMADFWNVSTASVDALVAVYLYVYVPGSFISIYLIVNHLGLRRGLMLGAVLNTLGALIRLWGCSMGASQDGGENSSSSYTVVYVGTLLAATAQTFTLSTPPLIAGRWFGSTERATATAVGVLANQLGTLVGLAVTIVVDFRGANTAARIPDEKVLDNSLIENIVDVEKLKTYLGVQVILAVIALLAVSIFVSDYPLTPPSKAAALVTGNKQRLFEECQPDDNHGQLAMEQTALLTIRSSPSVVEDVECYPEAVKNREAMADGDNPNSSSAEPTNDRHPSYMESIRLVATNASHRTFCLAFGMSVGVYYTIPTFISQLVPFCSPAQQGWLGLAYVAFGIIGSFGAGRLVDLTQEHRVVCLSLVCGALLSLLAFAYTAATTSPLLPEDAASAPMPTPSILVVTGYVVGIIGSGFSLAAWNTVGFEYGTALTFPADEAAVAGLLECGTELSGFAWVTLGGFLIESYGRIDLFVGLLLLAVLTSFLLLWRTNHAPKRPA